jgi:murein DD-endopeptidase MepM/ murein hydrolase activator NlpD
MHIKKSLPAITSLSLLLIISAGLVFSPAVGEAQSSTDLLNSSNGQSSALTAAKAELEARIQAKSKDLDALNSELSAKQKELQSTQSQRVSLQRDLSLIEKNISQLQTSIKTDQTTAEKLGLEIDKLTYDIKDIEHSIGTKNQSIGILVTELHRRDSETPLITFLKSSSIAETLADAEAVRSMKIQLRDDVVNLSELKHSRETTLTSITEKKEEAEERQKNQIAKKAIIEEQKSTQKVILSQTQNKESVYQQQVADLKKQQDSLEDEIQSVEDQLRKNFNPDLAPSKGGGVFSYPVKMVAEGGTGRISQHYGEKSSLYRGKPHNGMDIATPIGTPVYAAADGVVSAAYNNDQSATRKYQYGKYVLIRHGNNLSTLYGHLSKQFVSAGEVVKRGQLIGYSGTTGYSTGPHVHFGLYWTASVELKSIPPAAGLVPVGVTLAPEDYL